MTPPTRRRLPSRQRQPTMRFVPIKTIDQQAILAWHGAREGWKEERTALMNRVRGLLTEFGIVIARSSDRLLAALPRLTEDPRLPDAMQGLLLEAREQLEALHARLARCEAQIANHARSNTAAQRASALLGIGPITSSALAATVPDATTFKSGRQFGAWLGLTPRQRSSGGKTRLGRISLRGNVYLRTLLIQGARSTLQSALKAQPSRASRLQRWIIELYGRRAITRPWSRSPTSTRASCGRCLPRTSATTPPHGNDIPWLSALPATRSRNSKQRFAAERDSKTRSDRTREQPGYSVGGHSTALGRSPARRRADFQIGLSRAASIVARADHGCATRPFAKTQSVPRLGRDCSDIRRMA